MRPAKTSIIHFLSQIGISIVGFVATWYFANVLGATIFGVFAVVKALLFWGGIPANAVGDGIRKRVSEGTDRGAFLSAGIALNFVVALVVAGTIAWLRVPLRSYIGEPVVDWLILLVVSYSAFMTVTGALNGQKLVAYTGALKFFERIVRVGLQVTLLLLAYGLVGMFAGQVVSFVVASVVSLFVFRIRPSLPSRRHFRELLDYARYAWSDFVKSRALGPSVDILVLQALIASSALVGIYQVSWNIASILILVGTSIQQTLFPEISELATDEDYDEIRTLLSEGIAFTGIFAIPGLLGAGLLSSQLLALYGGEFSQGQYILILLIVARTLGSYASQLTSAVRAIDRADLAFRMDVLFIVTNVGLDIVLIYPFGWYGAALATIIAAALVLLVNYRVIVGQLDTLEIPYREIARQTAAALVMTGAVWTINSLVPWRNGFVTIGLVVFGAGVYGVVLFAISEWVRAKTESLLPESVLRLTLR